MSLWFIAEGRYHIAVFDLVTDRLTVLTETSLDESLSIAPNGSIVLYATKRGDDSILGAVAVDGGVVQPARRQGACRNPPGHLSSRRSSGGPRALVQYFWPDGRKLGMMRYIRDVRSCNWGRITMKNVTLCAKWIGLVFAALVLAACSSNETKEAMRPRLLLQRRRSRPHKRRRSAGCSTGSSRGTTRTRDGCCQCWHCVLLC